MGPKCIYNTITLGPFGIIGLSLGIKIAQKPYTVWSLGPKALLYESLDP